MQVYVVVKYGGEYEDSWDRVDSVYASKEAAERRVDGIEAELHPTMSRDVWNDLAWEVEDYEEKHDEYFEELVEGILFLHPEWRGTEEEEELREAKIAYYDNSDTLGAMIEEVEFYNE